MLYYFNFSSHSKKTSGERLRGLKILAICDLIKPSRYLIISESNFPAEKICLLTVNKSQGRTRTGSHWKNEAESTNNVQHIFQNMYLHLDVKKDRNLNVCCFLHFSDWNIVILNNLRNKTPRYIFIFWSLPWDFKISCCGKAVLKWHSDLLRKHFGNGRLFRDVFSTF